ncbi:MAG: phosphate/phosphite/phosphonate ABC transporter substrate-binding protein [Negativicutes bacterium]
MKNISWIGLVLSVVLLAGCGAPAAKSVRLQDPAARVALPSSRMEEKQPFRVAVSSILSPVETLDGYEPMLKYLEARLGRPVILLQRKTYQEVNQLLQDRGVDLAFVCSGGYMAGQGMELFAMPEVKGRRTYQSYIIARSGLPMDSLRALRGRSFAFTDPLSFSGHMAPLHMLLSMQIDPKTHFSRSFFTFSHDNSIRSVVEGIVDGAAVDSMIYDRIMLQRPEWSGKVRILEKSLMVGNPPVVVPQGMEPELKQNVRGILLKMHEDEAGRAALRRLDYDRFISPEETLYEPLKPVWQSVRGLL